MQIILTLSNMKATSRSVITAVFCTIIWTAIKWWSSVHLITHTRLVTLATLQPLAIDWIRKYGCTFFHWTPMYQDTRQE